MVTHSPIPRISKKTFGTLFTMPAFSVMRAITLPITFVTNSRWYILMLIAVAFFASYNGGGITKTAFFA